MSIRRAQHVVDMQHYPTPGSLDEYGLGRPVIELRDT